MQPSQKSHAACKQTDAAGEACVLSTFREPDFHFRHLFSAHAPDVLLRPEYQIEFHLPTFIAVTSDGNITLEVLHSWDLGNLADLFGARELRPGSLHFCKNLENRESSARESQF